MQEKESLYDLDQQLERAVAWVKFAEAKNGVALGLLGSAFVAFCNKDAWNSGLSGMFLIIVLAIQLLLLISSFVPRFSSPFLRKREVSDVNFHYYGDIAHVSLFEFRKRLVAAYQGFDENARHFKDVTHQIHINCEIAMVKFILFKITCFLTVLSGILFILNRWGIL